MNHPNALVHDSLAKINFLLVDLLKRLFNFSLHFYPYRKKTFYHMIFE